ncbi:MAG: serine hydrolase domain-containing protein, partial [Chitinophagaceae bacterium]
ILWGEGNVQAQTIIRLDKSTISPASLDTEIEALMTKANVQGLAIAVFNKNKPVFKKTYGYKNLSTREPIRGSTNIYGASLSKSVFAVMVMKLVEEGKLDLDKPLQSYLPKPIYEYTPAKKWHDNYSDLETDTLYGQVTARHCLDHTSGFPNWRWIEPDQKLRVKFKPGTRYSYSGEGLVYLQVVLEKMTGRSLEDLMEQHVFMPADMTNSSYTWQNRFQNDYAVGHKAQGDLYDKDTDNEARSASTLETTIDDMTLFLKAVLNNSILKPATRKRMFSTQMRIRTIRQFGPLSLRDSTGNDKIALGYGLGWGLLKSPYGVGAFKEGHGDGFQHYMILYPDTGIGVLIMTNSDNGESIFKDLLAYAIGDVYTPWYWEGYIPYNTGH